MSGWDKFIPKYAKYTPYKGRLVSCEGAIPLSESLKGVIGANTVYKQENLPLKANVVLSIEAGCCIKHNYYVVQEKRKDLKKVGMLKATFVLMEYKGRVTWFPLDKAPMVGAELHRTSGWGFKVTGFVDWLVSRSPVEAKRIQEQIYELIG